MNDVNWSKIGKHSRRKGKKFEQDIARMLRLGMGENWQTTRNSGRTDIKGDIYCSKYPFIMIECKHRKSFSLRSMVQKNGLFQKAVIYIIDEFNKFFTNSSILIIFLKNETGLWVMVDFSNSSILNEMYIISDIQIIENGRIWQWLGKNITSDEGKEFMSWLQKKLQNGGI